MLPYIGAPQRIFHALVCHLRDDVVGQLDCPLYVMNLALLTEQSHFHDSRRYLIPVRFPRLGILELADLTVVGVVEATCQVVVMGASGTYDCWVDRASGL